MVFRAWKSIGREIRRKCRGTCVSGGALSLGMAWRRDEQSPLSWALLVCPCCSWACSSPVAVLSSLLCLVPASLWSLWPPWFTALLGSLNVSGSWQATDLTWGWVITCLLSHAQEVGHKKAPDINFPLHRGGIAKWWVGLCPHLSLFSFLLLFLSCSILPPLLLIAVFFTPFPLSPPSFTSLPPLCRSLLLLSPPLALFCLIFSVCFLPISKLSWFFLAVHSSLVSIPVIAS